MIEKIYADDAKNRAYSQKMAGSNHNAEAEDSAEEEDASMVSSESDESDVTDSEDLDEDLDCVYSSANVGTNDSNSKDQSGRKVVCWGKEIVYAIDPVEVLHQPKRTIPAQGAQLRSALKRRM